MKREFIETQTFSNSWNELDLTDDDLQQLQNFIMQNPGAGDIIKGTGGLIKMRWNLPDTGKSGGIRVLYINFIHQEVVILINCYGKSIKDTITDKEKAVYKSIIKEIKKELKS